MYYLKGLPNMLSGQLQFLKSVFLLKFQPKIKEQRPNVCKCVPTLANHVIHVQWPDRTFPFFSTIIHGQRGELFNRCE